MVRLGSLLSTVLLLACVAKTTSTSGSGSDPAPRERFRADLLCTERPPGGEEACRAKGCRWGPALSCHGAEPPLEEMEAERRAYEEGTVGCDCVCADDERWCSEVP
jgi:hypothetical protein